MLTPKLRITFTQKPTATYANRTDTFVINYAHKVTTSDSWTSLTNTAKVEFAKNIIFKNQDGKQFDLTGKPLNASSAAVAPFFMRGDIIKIEACFWYDNQRKPFYTIFEGFVTKIKLENPVVIECEDNMYQLKQIQAPKKTYKGSLYNVEDIVSDMLLPTDFTVAESPSQITTNIGTFITHLHGQETIAQVLERLLKTARIHSFFKGSTLYTGAIVYYPEFIKKPYPIFIFEKNILPQEHDLDYTRADDVRFGAKCYSVSKVELTGANLNGKKKTSHKRLEVNVGDSDGEIRTMFFFNVKDVATLKKLGEQRLPRYKYEGYRGKFKTFGEPFVEVGMQIILASTSMPERNGLYYVKSVNREIGVGGYWQTIEVDIKVADIDKNLQITTRNLTEQEVAEGI